MNVLPNINSLKTAGIILVILYSALHIVPYSLSPYTYASYDYLTVKKAISYDQAPTGTFPDKSPQANRFYARTTGSPVYMNVIVRPLSQILSVNYVLYLIAFLLTTSISITFFFSFTSWPWGVLSAWFVSAVTLHMPTFGTINGHDRNFSFPLLFAFLAVTRTALSSKRKRYVGWLLVALSAGIYAPAGLLLLLCFVAWEVNNHHCILPLVRRISIAGLVYVTTLLPYLILTLETTFFGKNPLLQTITWPLVRKFNSASGIFKTMIYHSSRDYIGAFFINIHVVIATTLLLTLLIVGYCYDRSVLSFHVTEKTLLFGGIFLWVCAHFLFPALHKPNRFTAIGVVGALLFRAGWRIKTITRSIFYLMRNNVGWVGGIFTSITALIALNISSNTASYSSIVTLHYWLVLFLFGVLLFLLAPNKVKKQYILGCFIFVLFILVGFCLHKPYSFEQKVFDKAPGYYQPFINKINKNVKKGSVIAGPPSFLDFVTTMTNTTALFTNNTKTQGKCRALRTFLDAYYSPVGKQRSLQRYSNTYRFDYFIIYRTLFTNPQHLSDLFNGTVPYYNTYPRAACREQKLGPTNTASFLLNQNFDDYTVKSHDSQLYLISRSSLQQWLQQK